MWDLMNFWVSTLKSQEGHKKLIRSYQDLQLYSILTIFTLFKRVKGELNMFVLSKINYTKRDLYITWVHGLVVGNSCDSSHLRVKKLWIRVVTNSIIAWAAPCYIRVGFKWVEDNYHMHKLAFFLDYKKKRREGLYTWNSSQN